jgi:hypothetical protein
VTVAREIRALERGDLEQVAGLYEHVARSGSRTPPPRMVEYFERSFFDYPWADPEIPSLVHVEDDGRITGFLGSSVRRFTFDGRPVRAGISGQLVTEPDARSRAPGAFLMRRYMQGPQELTLTDTASEVVRRIWEGVGGETFHLACVGWVRVFRPWQFLSGYRGRAERHGAPGRARPVLSALDTVTTGVLRRVLRPRSADAASGSLEPAEIVRALPTVARSARLRPAYDEAFLDWQFGAMAEIPGRGELRRRVVRVNGDVRGWYVYYRQPGGISQVLQVAGEERDVGTILDDLFRDAHDGGAAGVQGRVEAHLRAELAQRRCVFHQSGYLSLIHSGDRDLLHAVQSGDALLTRMEGEWWMGHHLLPFDA